MKVTVTARELLDRGLWIEFCEKRGINSWAINEGQMLDSEEFELTPTEAIELGLLKRTRN